MEIIRSASLPGTVLCTVVISCYQSHKDCKTCASLRTKTLLIAINTLRNLLVLGFFLALFTSDSEWPSFSSSSLISSSNALIYIWMGLFCLLAIPLPIVYFYNENKCMKTVRPSSFERSLSDSFVLTLLSIISVLALFVLTTLFAQIQTESIYASQTLTEKFTSFVVSLLCILLFGLGGSFTIKPLFNDPITSLRQALDIELQVGVFNETTLLKEIDVNNDELQYFLEKYSMTGNLIPRSERKRYEKLKKQRNLLLHRANLTSQFVTKKARIKNILQRTKAMLVAMWQILLSFCFLLTMVIILLGLLLPDLRILAETLVLPSKWLAEYLSNSEQHLVTLISTLIIKIFAFSYLYDISTSAESPAQLENKRLKKALNKCFEIDEVQQSLIDNKKLKTSVINLSIACFFIVTFMAFFPTGQLLLDPEKCVLLTETRQFLGAPLPSECGLTSFGYLYNVAIVRTEFKALMFFLITAYTIRALVEIVLGVFNYRNEVKK